MRPADAASGCGGQRHRGRRSEQLDLDDGDEDESDGRGDGDYGGDDNDDAARVHATTLSADSRIPPAKLRLWHPLKAPQPMRRLRGLSFAGRQGRRADDSAPVTERAAI